MPREGRGTGGTMSRNRVFFGCNYNDRRIKGQFDQLKVTLEREYPLDCIIVDKVASQPARDFWQAIVDGVEGAAACFFDVTAFRSNVVLELGYALAARKGDDEVFITWCNRKKKGGKDPAWALSDITHLRRHEYKNVAQLRTAVEGQLATIPFMKDIANFREVCKGTSDPDNYYDRGLAIMREMRDHGQLTKTSIDQLLHGSPCNRDILLRCLQDSGLVRRNRGRFGRYYLDVEA